jgi:hypothetical protein
MNKKIRGFIMRNMIYLVVFYILYFLFVPFALYGKGMICGLDIFTTYCDQIPASTNLAMNFIMFVVVPIAAFIFAITASTEKPQQYTQYTYGG